MVSKCNLLTRKGRTYEIECGSQKYILEDSDISRSFVHNGFWEENKGTNKEERKGEKQIRETVGEIRGEKGSIDFKDLTLDRLRVAKVC